MRMDILIPVCVDLWNEPVERSAKKMLAPDIDLRVCNLKKGVEAMESAYDVAIASPYVIEAVRQLEYEGSDGIVLYCFKDPVIDACKEVLSIPIVGIREASIALASLLGENISVITSRNYSVTCYKRALRGKVNDVSCLNIPVLDLGKLDLVLDALDREISKAKSIGSDVIVLGCGSILDIDFHKLEQKYKLPIVVPLYAAVSVCDCFIRSNLRQSKQAFPFPEISTSCNLKE